MMWKAAFILAATAALSGCAAMRDVTSDVSTYSEWPAERKPGTYAFERLPSQQADPARQQTLEEAARPAIEGAGFTPASDPKNADVNVQVGARVNANESLYYEDPFWWRGGMFYGHRRPFWGPGFWGPGFATYYPASQTYEREVALLIRDRKSSQVLYESRATTDGASPSINALLGPMFQAAMKDFPHRGINPRRVTTPMAAAPQ